ncbi:MAG TPA: DUF5668 domain-containing protein [Bryobacteraceae bacterium]|nr:DUF5668 domain-containing protein [Bryobacteraceae bacterium]
MNSNEPALFRAIRGPILLIALGALFLVDQFTQYGFWQTWPVLVILVGTLKLAEHLSARKPRDFETPEGAS